MEKKLLTATAFLIMLNLTSMAGYEKDPSTSKKRIFSKEDILRLADVYVNNNLKIKNPAFVDVDGDGDFDILSFEEGNVEYYENIGTLEKPEFILENKNYDTYKTAFMIQSGMPMPVFFADADGDGDMDLFAVKDKGINQVTKKRDYRILYAANSLDIDTATLVTIILILVIVLLLLAILR